MRSAKGVEAVREEIVQDDVEGLRKGEGVGIGECQPVPLQCRRRYDYIDL